MTVLDHRSTRALPLLTLMFVGSIHAQVDQEPGFNWALITETAWEDNIYRTPDELAESDGYFALTPQLTWAGYSGANQFDVALQGDFRRYFDNDALDYSAGSAQAHAFLGHTARVSTDYRVGFETGIESPGDNAQLFLPGFEPNQFERINGAWTIRYGSRQAAGQLEARLSYADQTFDNNNQQFRDTTNTGASGTFYWRVAPRTRLLLQANYNEFDFANADSFSLQQSGDETRLLAGVTWEATGKTTGQFRIGYQDRTFEVENFEDLSGLALALAMVWEPDEATLVDISAQRANESSPLEGIGGFVNTGAAIAFTRDISARTRLVSDLQYREQDFEQVGRTDDWWDFGIGIEYDLSSRLTLGLQYRYEDRTSTDVLFDYTTNIALLTLTITPPR